MAHFTFTLCSLAKFQKSVQWLSLRPVIYRWSAVITCVICSMWLSCDMFLLFQNTSVHGRNHVMAIWRSNCIWHRLEFLMKKCSERQTLHAGCSQVETKNFAPPQTPFPGARDGQNLISWRWSLPLPTDPVWWGLMHAISSYRGNRPTNTHKQTHRQDQ